MKSISDRDGFVVIEKNGVAFGRYQSKFFTKKFGSKSVSGITSPAAAFSTQGGYEYSIQTSEIAKISVDREDRVIVIYNSRSAVVTYKPASQRALRAARKCLHEQIPDSWRVKIKRKIFEALFVPIFVGTFIGAFLGLIGMYAADIEAGNDVEPATSFRHKRKSELAIAVAQSIGTSGVKLLAIVLAVSVVVWVVIEVVNSEDKTTFKPSSRKRKRLS